MAITINKVSQSNFKDEFEFGEAAHKAIQGGPLEGMIFEGDVLLVINKKFGSKRSETPSFLRSAKQFLDAQKREYPLGIVLIETGENIDNPLHPLRRHIQDLRLPYVKYGNEVLAVDDINQLRKKLADSVRRRYHNYFLISENPVKVFGVEDLRELGISGLIPLNASSARDIIEALVSYHSLFKKVYTSITGKDGIKKTAPETIETKEGDITRKSIIGDTQITIKNVVEFGGYYKYDDFSYFFGASGWYILNMYGKEGDYIFSSDAGEVVDLIENTHQNRSEHFSKDRMVTDYQGRVHIIPYDGFKVRLAPPKNRSYSDEKFVHSLENLIGRVRRAAGLEDKNLPNNPEIKK